jgi:hypothetical protein
MAIRSTSPLVGKWVLNLSKELHLVQPSIYSVDPAATLEWKAFVEDTIGDAFPVRTKNTSMHS